MRMLAVARTETQQMAELPDPSAIDIWASEPNAIRLQTQCMTWCPHCRGTGRMTCTRCRGSSRVQCHGCGGDGHVQREDRIEVRGPDLSVHTATVKRTEPCLACRGSGKVECTSCQSGKVECTQCDGSAVVEAWIEVSVERTGQVRVAADFDVEAMHAAVANSEDFDTPAEQLPAELIADTGWQLPDGFANCPETLKYLLDARKDRVRGVRVQQLRARGVQVTVATRMGREVVEFAGRPPQLVSGPIRVLGQRAGLSLGMGVAALALGFVAVGYYHVGRSTWFTVHGRAETLGLLAVLAGGLVGAFVLGVTLPNLRRSALRWGAPLTGLLLTIAVAVDVWRSVEPELLTARAAIERGDLERAEEELQALAELGRDAAGIAEVRAELRAAHGHEADRERLTRLHAADEIADAAEILREPWYDAVLRDEQITSHAQRARTAIDGAWTESRADTLEQLVVALRGLDPALASEAETLADLLDLRAAIGREEFVAARTDLDALASTDATADERSTVATELREAIAATARRDYALGLDLERSHEDRAASLAAFEALAKLHEQLTGEAPSDVDLEVATTVAEKLAKAIEKARVAREREEARALKAERRRHR